MGYCVGVWLSGVVIPKKKLNSMAAAFKNENPAYTLEGLAEEYGYSLHTKDNGDIEVDEFLGEKWHEDDVFYGMLAPFVENGGCIEVTGEDGEKWKYEFNGKECKEYFAETKWKFQKVC